MIRDNRDSRRHCAATQRHAQVHRDGGIGPTTMTSPCPLLRRRLGVACRHARNSGTPAQYLPNEELNEYHIKMASVPQALC